MTYFASRPTYSSAGILVVLGFAPWAIGVEYLIPPSTPWASVASFVVALIPGVLWFYAKWSGPDGALSWFFVRRSSVTLKDVGAEWVDYRDRHGFVAWQELEGIERRGLHMTFVLSSRPTVAVPISLDFVGPKDGTTETSLAMMLASQRTDDFVAGEPIRSGFPSGMRRRLPGDSPTVAVYREVNRAYDRSMVSLWIVIIVYSLVGRLLGP